ncbi:TolC family protein [Fibrella aquatica]|jgi:outer membrane protein TolC|uniref:TolC family protein n=1 Tax=Fibrella aquatica TaxID=3242487 RepID=UPI0035202242
MAQNTGARGMVSFGRSAGLPGDTLYLDINQDLAVQLLPFDQLLKVAIAYSPLLKYQDEVVNGLGASVDQTKALIYQNLSGNANYSTGDQTILATSTLPAVTVPTVPAVDPQRSTLGQIANGYRVGIDFRISLYELFGRKHQIRQAKSNQRAAELQRDVLELQIKQQLIQLYQDMITAQQMLKIRLLDEQASLTAYRLAELDLQKGRINASTMATLTTQYVQAKAVSEQVKGDFLKNVHFFEAVMGVPIQRLKR